MAQHDGIDVDARAPWRSITEVFAMQVGRRPDALAVEAQNDRRSYADMARTVDAFAAALFERLGDPSQGGERLVGVCLARDVDLPAWLMAVFRVSAAYLPIDPATPPTRLAHMLEDARPHLIVASRHHAHVVADAGIPVLYAEDAIAAALTARPLPLVQIRPDTLAYVIFTSGSTGRPKGVEIEHGSLIALLATMARNPGFGEGEKMLGITRISFDLSVPDMFLPFFAGGSLAIVDGDVAADPDRLAEAFAQYRPDLAQGTPSTWRALLEGSWQGLPDLRILAGGEAVTRALADRLLPRCAALWNIYGPTEATVWATICRIRPGIGAISIGKPMDGVSVQVTDARNRPLPHGETGEIVIGGVGVARGYRNRPALTADRFVVLPDGTRIYRTGDLGRFDRDGALYCLGRLDDQVKVRGFRIELGDVEGALALHPAVAWCAVRVWTDPSDEPVLVAYCVLRPGETAGAGAVKSFLAARLAGYMIPDRIVFVTAMPLTPNGKVDRSALPDPFTPSSSPARRHGADIPARLRTIWQDLLHVSVIAGDDDFFALGGYSLMTVRLARRIEAEFSVKLALVDLMQHATLDAMAERIERGDVAAEGTPMLLNAGGTRPPLFWLDAGPLMRTIMRALSADQPAYALNLNASDEAALGTGDLSIQAVATRLRLQLVSAQPCGPYYLGGWCRWGIVAYELACQLIARGERVELLVLLDAERPDKRSAGPQFRARLKSWLRRSTVVDEAPSISQRVEVATRSYVAGHHIGNALLLRPMNSNGDAGWRAVIDGGLQVERIPGDHLSMVRGEPALVVARTLDTALQVAQSQTAYDPVETVRTAQAG